jgi:hypothetical protein
MEGGTYARALQVKFTEDQATFFSHFSIDLKNETVQRVRSEMEILLEERKLKNRLAKRLKRWVDIVLQ